MVEALNSMVELEPLPKHKIIMLGATRGTGLVIAQKFIQQGYDVFLGGSSKEKCDKACKNILEVTGIQAGQFAADLTKPEEIKRAYEESGIQPNEPVHFFDFAAAGFEKLLRPLARPLSALSKAHEGDIVTIGLVNRLTEDIKAIVTDDKALTHANRVNRDAPYELGKLLQANGNLGPESVITTLSSNVSDYTNPEDQEHFPGPWLYWPVGRSKAEGSKLMKLLSRQTGAKYVDFVAPEIEETDVITLFHKILPWFQGLQDGVPLTIPSVTKEQVANTMWYELMRKDMSEERRKVYITSGGSEYQTPHDWKIPVIPFL